MATTYPLPLPSVRLTVNGVDRTATNELVAGTLVIHQILGSQVDTAAFDLFPPSSWRPVNANAGAQPQVGQSVLVEVQNGTGQPYIPIFGGTISAVNEVKVVPGKIRWECSCVDYTNLLTRVLVNKTYIGWTVSDIVRDIVRQYAPQIIVDANVQDALTVIDKQTFAYQYTLDIIDALAQIVGYAYYVDASKVLHFYDPDTTQASTNSITDTSQNFENLAIEPQLNQVRNRVFVQGGDALSALTSEQYDANGQTVSFPLKHDNVLAQLAASGVSPFMTIDGVQQRVGLAGIVDESNFAGGFILDATKGEVRTPIGTTAVADGSRIIFAYQWLVPVGLERESTASQAAVAALEGSAYFTVVSGDAPILYYRMNDNPNDAVSVNGQFAINQGAAGATGLQYNGLYLGGNYTQAVQGALNADPNFSVNFAGGRVVCYSGARIPGPSGSLEAWVRTSTIQTGSTLPNGFPAYREAGIVGQWDTTFSKGGAFLWLCSGGTYALGYDNGSVAGQHLIAYAASGTPSGVNWDHVVATWQAVGGARYRSLYVNNTLVGADTVIVNPAPVPGSGIEIGNYNYASSATGAGRNTLAGFIDEVAVYDYALSGSQVSDHYYSGRYAGVREFLLNDTSITSFDNARRRGDVELARWGNVLTDVTFESWTAGWQIGDTVTINVTAANTGHTFNGTALIQELEIAFVGAQRARYSAKCQSTRFNFLDYQKQVLGIGAQVQQGQAAALNVIELATATQWLVIPGSTTATVNTPPFHVRPDWGTGTTPYIVVGFWAIDPTLY